MERTFPLCDQQATRECVYLRTNGIYDRLVAELDRSVEVMALVCNRNRGGSILTVQHYLFYTYGGSHLDYPYRKCTKNSYLIQLPAGVDENEVMNSGVLWDTVSDWWFSHWSRERDANTQAKHLRVRIKITNFPLEFWHPSFIHQVVSEFDEVDHIDDENILGSDRTCVNLWMNCIDPRRIPTSTLFPYSNRWKECSIHIVTWEYNSWIPPEARFSAMEEQNLYIQHGEHQKVLQ